MGLVVAVVDIFRVIVRFLIYFGTTFAELIAFFVVLQYGIVFRRMLLGLIFISAGFALNGVGLVIGVGSIFKIVVRYNGAAYLAAAICAFLPVAGLITTVFGAGGMILGYRLVADRAFISMLSAVAFDGLVSAFERRVLVVGDFVSKMSNFSAVITTIIYVENNAVADILYCFRIRWITCCSINHELCIKFKCADLYAGNMFIRSGKVITDITIAACNIETNAGTGLAFYVGSTENMKLKSIAVVNLIALVKLDFKPSALILRLFRGVIYDPGVIVSLASRQVGGVSGYLSVNKQT